MSITVQAGLDELPVEWFGGYRYGAYRNYRLFSKRQQDQLAAAALSGCEVLALKDASTLKAVVGTRTLEWDSLHLDRPCGRLGPLYWIEGTSESQLTELLASGRQRLAENGIPHVDLELDASDTLAMRAAQASGFQLLDTRLTYLGTKQHEFKRPGRARFELRNFVPEDRTAVLKIADQMLPTIGGRFANDPSLDPEKAKSVYLSWFRDCLGKDSDYRIELALRQGEIAGFLAYRLLNDIYDLTGKRIFGRGLSAVVPDARGAYVDLLYETINRDYHMGDAIEFEASITNPRSFRIFERLGLGLVRTRYALLASRDHKSS